MIQNKFSKVYTELPSYKLCIDLISLLRQLISKKETGCVHRWIDKKTKKHVDKMLMPMIKCSH